MKKATLLAIFFLALGLRLWGIEWGLPSATRPVIHYPDEYTVIWLLSRMHPSQLDFDLKDLRNPTFFYYQVAAALKAADICGVVKLNQGKDYFRAHRDQYARLFIVGRLLVVAYSLLLVFLIFLITENAFGAAAGLWAAFLWAIAPISVYSAHCMEVSTPLCFWVALCWYLCLRALDSKRIGLLYGAAVCFGLSVSIKYLAAPVALLCVTAHFLMTRKIVTNALIACAAIALAAFFIGTPYALVDHQIFLTGIKNIFAISGLGQGTRWSFAPLHIGYSFGWAVLAVGVVGFVWALREKRPLALMSAPFWLAMMLLLGASHLQVTRYYLMPGFFLLPFAGFGFVRLLEKIPARNPGARIAAYGCAALLLAPVLLYSFGLSKMLASPDDSRDLASAWIVDNIPRGASIGVWGWPYWYTPPVLYSSFGGTTDERLMSLSDEQRPYRVEQGDATAAWPWKDQPDYLVLSDVEVGRSFSSVLGGAYRALEFPDYTKIAEFERVPMFLGISFPKRPYYTYEWCMPNPTIGIWKRSSRAPLANAKNATS